MSGRVAELLGLNLVIKMEKKKYILNKLLVEKVLANNSKLDCIQEELKQYFDQQDKLDQVEIMSHQQKGAKYYE